MAFPTSLFAALSMSVVLALATGCADPEAILTPQVALSPSAAARTLAVSIDVSPQAQAFGLAPALHEALRGAGFHVVTPQEAHDAVVRLEAARMTPDRAGIRLGVFQSNSAVEVLRMDGVRTDRPLASRLDRLVDGLARSPRIEAFAASVVAERDARERAEAARLEAERRAEEARLRKAREEEEAAWAAAKAPGCATPTTVDACDAVDAYVKRYPTGIHTAEGTDLVRLSVEPIAVLRDDLAWARAGEDDCAKPAAEEACEGIDKYLAEHAEGHHVARARELLKKAAFKLRLLRVAREAAEAREEARVRWEAAHAGGGETSGGSGSEGSGGYYGSGGRSKGGSVYVRSYYRKNGTYVSGHTRRR